MKLSTALSLGRVSNLPTVASNVLTGVVLSGARPSPLVVVGWVLAMAAFYTGGMFLNDAMDREWDGRHRPERPIPSGAVSAAAVFVSGFVMLALGVVAVFLLAGGLEGSARSLPATISALALAGTIIAYDAHHKNNPLGPFIMGACRVLIYVTVAIGLAGKWEFDDSYAALALYGYLIGLTYIARQENLRELTNLWPLVLLAAPLVVGFPRALAIESIFFVLLLGWIVHALSFLFGHEKRDIPGAVARLIAGISLVDALLVAAHLPSYAVLCVGAMVLTRLLHRRIAGT